MLFSKLQVSSSSQIVFLVLLSNTRSGLERVTRMSGGIVLPLMSNLGMSANTSKSSGLLHTCQMVEYRVMAKIVPSLCEGYRTEIQDMMKSSCV